MLTVYWVFNELSTWHLNHNWVLRRATANNPITVMWSLNENSSCNLWFSSRNFVGCWKNCWLVFLNSKLSAKSQPFCSGLNALKCISTNPMYDSWVICRSASFSLLVIFIIFTIKGSAMFAHFHTVYVYVFSCLWMYVTKCTQVDLTHSCPLPAEKCCWCHGRKILILFGNGVVENTLYQLLFMIKPWKRLKIDAWDSCVNIYFLSEENLCVNELLKCTNYVMPLHYLAPWYLPTQYRGLSTRLQYLQC